jgi:spermidine/putrescine transport system permease protein
VSGTLLTFTPACGDYINAELLGTPNQYMVGNRIQSAFLTEHNYPLAASLSLILMAIVVVMVVFYVRRSGTEDLL